MRPLHAPGGGWLTLNALLTGFHLGRLVNKEIRVPRSFHKERAPGWEGGWLVSLSE